MGATDGPTDIGPARPQRRRAEGNFYAGPARAVAASGIFRLRLGRLTVGRAVDKVYAAVVAIAYRALSPWWDSRFINALRAIVPPAPLRMLALQSWEPETTRVFQSLLRPGMRVVDAGAQIGYYTLLAAMEVGPTGHVYAFEPDPDVVPLLQQNVRLGGYGDRVTVVPMALSDRQGQTDLFLGKGRGVSSLFLTRDAGDAALVDKDTAEISTVRLDTFLAERAWPPVDLIKMDIEGAERLALAGMTGLTQRYPRLRLIVEFCPWIISDAGGTPEEFFDALAGAGFTRVGIVSDEVRRVRVPQDLPWLVELGDRSTVNLLCEKDEA